MTAQVNVISIGMAENPVVPVIVSIPLGALGCTFQSCQFNQLETGFMAGLFFIAN